jgi:hypothetical protein
MSFTAVPGELLATPALKVVSSLPFAVALAVGEFIV